MNSSTLRRSITISKSPIHLTGAHLSTLLHRLNFKDALKFGFFDMQTARDWYRDVTSDVGMHADLLKYWIRSSCLLVMPIAPHFAEHIWTEVLKQSGSVQNAAWPTPSRAPDQATLKSGVYMQEIVKTIRDAELLMLKKAGKNKQISFDPKKAKSVRVYVATAFPDWQESCVGVVKDSYDEGRDKVDDAKVRTLLTERGLMKNKLAMPFVQQFKVCKLGISYSKFIAQSPR